MPARATPSGTTRILGIDRAHLVGYLYGLLTAACWGASSIFVRKGLVGLPSALWGIAVALGAATFVNLIWVRLRPSANALRIAGWRTIPQVLRHAIGFQLLAGVLAALGSVARTAAIDNAPVAVAISLTQTTSFFTLFLAPLLLGRHVERVTLRLILGATLVVAGSVLVVISLSG